MVKNIKKEDFNENKNIIENDIDNLLLYNSPFSVASPLSIPSFKTSYRKKKSVSPNNNKTKSHLFSYKNVMQKFIEKKSIRNHSKT